MGERYLQDWANGLQLSRWWWFQKLGVFAKMDGFLMEIPIKIRGSLGGMGVWVVATQIFFIFIPDTWGK